MKFIKSKKGLVVLGAVVVALAASIGAYAYFTSTGSGSGAGKVGDSTTWEVNTDAYTDGPMTPGGGIGTYESVLYRVTNNSTGQQNLANVNIKVAKSDGSPWSAQADLGQPACTEGDFQISVDGGLTWAAAGASRDDTVLAGNLAPGDTTADGTITLRMIDTGFNQDNCKTQDVPLYLYAS